MAFAIAFNLIGIFFALAMVVQSFSRYAPRWSYPVGSALFVLNALLLAWNLS